MGDARHSNVNPIVLTENDIERTEKVGEGAFGIVSAIKYKGHDPALIRLADRGELVLKEFRQNDNQSVLDNETIITPFLHQKSQEIPDLGKKCNISAVVKMDDKLYLMGKRVVFDEGPPPQSSDLEKYIQTLSENTHFQTTGNPGRDAFDNQHIAHTLNELTLSMKDAQNALHTAGIFHFDTAARNLLVNSTYPIGVTITDFGVSEKIPENGVIDYDSRRQLAFKWVDQASFAGRHTIATDLYALKISILETISLSLGMRLSQIVNLPVNPGEDPNNSQAFMNTRKELSDDEAMSIYLRNLDEMMQHPAQYQLNSERCNQMQLFINAYRDYLSQMPTGCKSSGDYSKEEIGLIRNEDNQRLMEATNRFNHDQSLGIQQQTSSLNRNDINEAYQSLQTFRASWEQLRNLIVSLPNPLYLASEEEKKSLVNLLASLSTIENLAEQNNSLSNKTLMPNELAEIQNTIVGFYNDDILQHALPAIDHDIQKLTTFLNKSNDNHPLPPDMEAEALSIKRKVEATGADFFPSWQNLLNQFATLQSAALPQQQITPPSPPIQHAQETFNQFVAQKQKPETKTIPTSTEKPLQNEQIAAQDKSSTPSLTTKTIFERFIKSGFKKDRQPTPSDMPTHYRSMLPSPPPPPPLERTTIYAPVPLAETNQEAPSNERKLGK